MGLVALLLGINIILGVDMASPYLKPPSMLPEANECRAIVWLNGEWDFAPQKGEFKFPEDTSWSDVKIRIPSPWNVNSFSGGKGPGGDFRSFPSYPKEWETAKAEYGWHRRTFELKKQDIVGRRVILHFDAVMYEAQVFVNGKPAGTDADGFLPLEFDITDLVREGKNELVVGVRNWDYLKVNGRFTTPTGSFWGLHIKGIWQDVYLKIIPEISVEDIFVKTSFRNKSIEVRAAVKNDSSKKARVKLSFIIERTGKTAGDLPAIPDQEVEVEPSAQKEVIASADWQDPCLWSPDTPSLYYMKAVVYSAEKKTDENKVRFGFREIWIQGRNFFLNGVKLKLRGDGWHFMGIPQLCQDYARAWFRLAKDSNENIVRLHAQVYPSYYLDAADEMGMLITDESAIWASHCSFQYTDGFWARAEQHVRRLVLRDRNHPSVIFWSVENEISAAHGVQQNDGSSGLDELFEKTGRLAGVMNSLDGTRPVSGDGSEDHKGRLEVMSIHYPGTQPPSNPKGKPVTIGEMGSMYYSTPPEVAPYFGDRVYESFANRLRAIGNEIDGLIEATRSWAELITPFNTVWYGMRPLPFSGKKWEYMDLNGPGVKPERLGPYTSTLNPGFDPELPLYEPNELYPHIKRSFEPQRIFFSDKSARFYSGENMIRKARVHNDTFHPAKLTAAWSVKAGEKQIASGSKDIELEPGEEQEFEFSFDAPAVKVITRTEIEMKLYEGNKTVFINTQAGFISPQFPQAAGVSRSLKVFTDSEAQAEALKGFGWDLKEIKDLSSLKNGSVMFVTGKKFARDNREELLGAVSKGARIIFFGNAVVSAGKWEARSVSAARVFPADISLPVFRDLEEQDLCFWGSSKNSARYAYAGSIPPNSRPIAFCADAEIVMYEEQTGKGVIIGCGMDVLGAESSDPAARVVLRNLVLYCAGYKPVKVKPVAFAGTGSRMLPVLEKIGCKIIKIQDGINKDLLADAVLVIDAGMPLDVQDTAVLREWIKKGNTVLVWGAKPEISDPVAQALGVKLEIHRRSTPALIAEAGGDSVLSGVNNALLYRIAQNGTENILQYSMESVEGPDKEKAELLVTSPEVDWMKWNWQGENTKIASIRKSELDLPKKAGGLLKLRYGKGVIYFCQIVPSAYSRKSTFLFEILLNNLGVDLSEERAEQATGIDEEGFIRTWLISGPFECKELSCAQILEKDLLGSEKDAKPELGKAWRKYTAEYGPIVSLQSEGLFNRQYSNAAAYAAAYIYSPGSSGDLLSSPKTISADLLLGSDDGVKAYLNGELIHSNPAVRPVAPDQDAVRGIKLRAGWNLLVLKIAQETGEWGFVARVLGKNGTPIPGMKADVQPGK